ncbi:MAG: bile acid:sodium symporter family protein [Pseudomonadota bacterium]
MDALLTIGLPISLAFIMLTLGLSLAWSDFGAVLKQPLPFLIGAFAQLVLVPTTAFLLLGVVTLPPELAFGVMLLAFCPGGVTTNLMARFARGDVALSISLTGLISLISVVTLPLLVSWASTRFLGEAAPPVDVTGLAIAMFLITAVPVLIGMTFRQLRPAVAERIEPGASQIGAGLFVVIVLAALAANWRLLMENVGTLGPILVALNVLLLAMGYGLARLFRVQPDKARTISVEAGVQNGTLGITVAGLLAAGPVLGPFAVPSGVYGITMYLVTLPVIFGLFRPLNRR